MGNSTDVLRINTTETAKNTLDEGLSIPKDTKKWTFGDPKEATKRKSDDDSEDVTKRTFDVSKDFTKATVDRTNEDAGQMKSFTEMFHVQKDIIKGRINNSSEVNQRRSDPPKDAFQKIHNTQALKDTIGRGLYPLKDSFQKVFDGSKDATKRNFHASKGIATTRFNLLKSPKVKFGLLKDSTKSFKHHIKNNNNNNKQQQQQQQHNPNSMLHQHKQALKTRQQYNNNNKKISHKQNKHQHQHQKQAILVNKKLQKPASKINKNISRKNITSWSISDESENIGDQVPSSNYGTRRDGYHGFHELPVPLSNANPFLHEGTHTTSPIFGGGDKMLTSGSSVTNEDVYETSIDHPSCHPTPCQLNSLPNHQNSIESLENSFTDIGGDHFGNTMSNYDNDYAGSIDDGFGRISDGKLLSKSNEETQLLSQAKNLMRNSKMMAMQANALENKAMLLDHKDVNFDDIGVDGLLSQSTGNNYY